MAELINGSTTQRESQMAGKTGNAQQQQMTFDDTDCVENPEGGFCTNEAIFFWRRFGRVFPGAQHSLEEADLAWPREKAQTALLWGLAAYFLREQEE